MQPGLAAGGTAYATESKTSKTFAASFLFRSRNNVINFLITFDRMLNAGEANV